MTGLVVHEWIARTGGSENVVEAALEALAPADLHCLWNDDPDRFAGVATTESWFAATPLRRSKMLALPFVIPTWRRTKAEREYDWLFVSSHSFAHHVRLPAQRDIRKFVYVHSPARYIWEPQLDHRGRGIAAAAIAPAFRWIDKHAAQRDRSAELAANSQFVRKRIQRCWGRESHVLYPPVEALKIAGVTDWATHLSEEESQQLEALPEGFLLGASRLVSYKRLDDVIAAGVAAGLPVVIVGSGPDRARLEDLGRDCAIPIFFLGAASSAMLYSLYQRCHAFIFPAPEDFGIMPVEALAAGTPVIGLAEGGVTESVIHGSTGYLVKNFDDPSEVREAVASVAAMSPSACRERAAQFDTSIFKANVARWVIGESR